MNKSDSITRIQMGSTHRQQDNGSMGTANRLFMNVSPDLHDRLLTTEEASRAIGISQYELRKGAAEGRYPVILLGSPANKFRKMRWRLDLLERAILNQAGQGAEGVSEL